MSFAQELNQLQLCDVGCADAGPEEPQEKAAGCLGEDSGKQPAAMDPAATSRTGAIHNC